MAVDFDLQITREVAWETLRECATSTLAVRMGVSAAQLGISLDVEADPGSSLGPHACSLVVRAGEDGIVELMTVQVPAGSVLAEESGWFLFVTMGRTAESVTLGIVLAATLGELLQTSITDEAGLLRKARILYPNELLSCLRAAGSFRETSIATCTPLGLDFRDTA